MATYATVAGLRTGRTPALPGFFRPADPGPATNTTHLAGEVVEAVAIATVTRVGQLPVQAGLFIPAGAGLVATPVKEGEV